MSSHITLIVCVPTTFSANLLFSAWQSTTILLTSGLTLTVMLDVVIQPPWTARFVLVKVWFLKFFPATTHFISAGGFEFSVVQVILTLSPALASVGPDILASVGATVDCIDEIIKRLDQKNCVVTTEYDHLQRTAKSTWAFRGAMLMMFETSHVNLALLSLALASKDRTFSEKDASVR